MPITIIEKRKLKKILQELIKKSTFKVFGTTSNKYIVISSTRAGDIKVAKHCKYLEAGYIQKEKSQFIDWYLTVYNLIFEIIKEEGFIVDSDEHNDVIKRNKFKVFFKEAQNDTIKMIINYQLIDSFIKMIQTTNYRR